jgi:agmatine deiminase
MIDYRNDSIFIVWPSVKPKYKNLFEFYSNLIEILVEHGIKVHIGFHLEYERKLIESTLPSEVKTYYDPNLFDIWARDFIGVEVNGKIIKPVYSPEYAAKVKPRTFKFEENRQLPIENIDDLILEFGNMIMNSNRELILCESVYKRNTEIKGLSNRLKFIFNLNRICYLPHDPEDCVGHADGMARFIDSDNIVLSDYREIPIQYDSLYKIENGKQFYQLCIDRINDSLPNKKITPFPFFVSNDPAIDYVPSARGVYINFLQFNSIIVVPQFNHEKDKEAISILENLTEKKIIPFNCNELAKFGGVLNCIAHTWFSSNNSN